MSRKTVRFGIIGCGLMGREFASAAARWSHLLDMDVSPEIVAVCDANPQAMQWFQDHIPSVNLATTDYREILKSEEVDAVYCAVPHNLHAQFYTDIIRAGKHLLGEKPFGIDQTANEEILTACYNNPEVLVRCSSEFPFYPGAYQIMQWVREGRFGTIIEAEAGFWHSSDLNPLKPVNWKRRVQTNGAYGCMGDLGMHVVHLPFRFGWQPTSVRAVLSNIMPERPDGKGNIVPCDTWDNAHISCLVQKDGNEFPLILSTKRIAPGHMNTWFIRVIGTEFSAEFSTKNPKSVRSMTYAPGGPQAWQAADIGYQSAYPTITGGIFEFGFPDAILQMWAAFLDELVNGAKMSQPLYCATPEETAYSHDLFTAALRSSEHDETVRLPLKGAVKNAAS